MYIVRSTISRTSMYYPRSFKFANKLPNCSSLHTLYDSSDWSLSWTRQFWRFCLVKEEKGKAVILWTSFLRLATYRLYTVEASGKGGGFQTRRGISRNFAEFCGISMLTNANGSWQWKDGWIQENNSAPGLAIAFHLLSTLLHFTCSGLFSRIKWRVDDIPGRVLKCAYINCETSVLNPVDWTAFRLPDFGNPLRDSRLEPNSLFFAGSVQGDEGSLKVTPSAFTDTKSFQMSDCCNMLDT